MRVEDDIGLLGKGNRGQFVADAFGPRAAAAHEYRHIGAEAQAECSERVYIQIGSPQRIKPDQHASRIRAAAAEATAHRNIFIDRDIGAERRRCVFLQQTRRAHAKVASQRYTRQLGRAQNLAVATHAQSNAIAPVKQLKCRLQQMVTISALANDMQEQIELGGRRPSAPTGLIVPRCG